jgi:hypothetical protein
MGKSDARIGFEKTYPDAFGTGNHPNALQVTKVFIDAIQILRGGLNTASYATVNELAQGFLRYTIHQVLERHPYADTFYFIFDYYPFVPLAKAVEQQKRRKKKQEEWVFDFDPEAEISEHWSIMLNDRHYGVPEILRAFTRIWIEDPPTDLGTILIDGHYLEEVNGLNVLNVPLYVSPQLKPAPELQNFWGEGDMKIPFLLKKVAFPNALLGAQDAPFVVDFQDSFLSRETQGARLFERGRTDLEFTFLNFLHDLHPALPRFQSIQGSIHCAL